MVLGGVLPVQVGGHPCRRHATPFPPATNVLALTDRAAASHSMLPPTDRCSLLVPKLHVIAHQLAGCMH